MTAPAPATAQAPKPPEATVTDVVALAAATEKATKEANDAAAVAAAAPKPAPKRAEGSKILVSGVLADQVNPLTNQRIPHGTETIAPYDRWIEIQLEAGVLVEVAL
jgi:hypothetical protein